MRSVSVAAGSWQLAGKVDDRVPMQARLHMAQLLIASAACHASGLAGKVGRAGWQAGRQSTAGRFHDGRTLRGTAKPQQPTPRQSSRPGKSVTVLIDGIDRYPRNEAGLGCSGQEGQPGQPGQEVPTVSSRRVAQQGIRHRRRLALAHLAHLAQARSGTLLLCTGNHGGGLIEKERSGWTWEHGRCRVQHSEAQTRGPLPAAPAIFGPTSHGYHGTYWYLLRYAGTVLWYCGIAVLRYCTSAPAGGHRLTRVPSQARCSLNLHSPLRPNPTGMSLDEIRPSPILSHAYAMLCHAYAHAHATPCHAASRPEQQLVHRTAACQCKCQRQYQYHCPYWPSVNVHYTIVYYGTA